MNASVDLGSIFLKNRHLISQERFNKLIHGINKIRQKKYLMALWTGFLNNEESVSLAHETPTGGPPLHPFQI